MVVVAVGLAAAGCANQESSSGGQQQAAPPPAGGMGANPHAGVPALQYQTPPGWIQEPPSSSMRLAQYRLPRAEGDPENATLALFYFGPQAGGGTQANIDRWVSQVSGADGSPPVNRGVTEIQTNGLKVSTVDVSGTYAGDGGMMGGGQATPKPNYRLLASVVETAHGSYFFKLTGPEATVQKWLTGYNEMLKTVALPSAPPAGGA
jgi:hypothetical protein